MKTLKFLASIATVLAAGALFAQTAPAPQQAAQQPQQASAPTGVNVTREGASTLITHSGNASDLALTSRDALEEFFRRTVAGSGVNNLHLAAMNSALSAARVSLANPNSPAQGQFSSNFKLDEVNQNNTRAVLLNGNLNLNGYGYALNTRSEVRADGGVNTTGSLVVTDPRGNASAPTPISMAIDPAGNVVGNVGDAAFAHRTPELLATIRSVTPTSRQEAVSANVTPDNTVVSTPNR